MDQGSEIQLPPTLYAVIGLFVVVGIYSAFDVLVTLVGGSLKLDLGFILLPCAYGLSQGSIGWRKTSIVLSMVFLLVNAVGAGMIFMYSEALSLFVYAQLLLGIIIPIAVYFILVSEKVEAVFKNEH